MFNNTSKILQHTIPGSLTSGVVLPHSDKVLFAPDIDKKIEKAKSQLEYLNQSLPHRNTHGGKAFRAKVSSIKDQIFHVSERMELLQSAKDSIRKSNLLSKISIAVKRVIPDTSAPMSYTITQTTISRLGGHLREISVLQANY